MLACRYPDGATPSLALWIGAEGVAAASNELGFSERDVRALCDVGASTKEDGKRSATASSGTATAAASASAAAVTAAATVSAADITATRGGISGSSMYNTGSRESTGEKGIGFKSVFSISDRPHVCSNGFSFAFDANDPSGLGYVLPHWDERSTAQAAVQRHLAGALATVGLNCSGALNVSKNGEQALGVHAWTTHIWLPLGGRLQADGSAGSGSSSGASISYAGAPASSAPKASWPELATEMVSIVSIAQDLNLHMCYVQLWLSCRARHQPALLIHFLLHCACLHSLAGA